MMFQNQQFLTRDMQAEISMGNSTSGTFQNIRNIVRIM